MVSHGLAPRPVRGSTIKGTDVYGMSTDSARRLTTKNRGRNLISSPAVAENGVDASLRRWIVREARLIWALHEALRGSVFVETGCAHQVVWHFTSPCQVRVQAPSRRRPSRRAQLRHPRPKTAALPPVASISHPCGKA